MGLLFSFSLGTSIVGEVYAYILLAIIWMFPKTVVPPNHPF